MYEDLACPHAENENVEDHTPEFEIGDGAPLLLISGPCQIESRDHALFHAEALHKAARSAGMNFVYKSSFDKANRTSLSAQRGSGLMKAFRYWLM